MRTNKPKTSRPSETREWVGKSIRWIGADGEYGEGEIVHRDMRNGRVWLAVGDGRYIFKRHEIADILLAMSKGKTCKFNVSGVVEMV